MNNGKYIATWTRWVITYPWLTLVLSLAWVAWMAAGIQHLGFKNNYRSYFGKDNPQLVAFEAIQNTYNKTDSVMFVVEPQDGTVFTNRTLEAVQALTEKAWQIPYSNRVDSITNFQNTTARGDELIVENLVKRPEIMTTKQLKRIKQIALNEPVLANRLVSPSGHVTGVNVTVQITGEKIFESGEIAEKSRAIAKEIEQKYPGIKLHLTGGAMMDNAFIESAMYDNKTLVPLMYGVIVLVLILCLNSISGTIATVLLLILSVSAALGMAGWFGWHLNPTSADSPTIILTMAVADCVHILMTALHNMRIGHEKRQALGESLRINFQPVFLTSLTTAVGFLSMNFSDAPPFRDLGNIVAIGVVVAWCLSITFLPAIMSVLPVRVKQEQESINKPMAQLSEWVIRFRRPLLIVNLLVAFGLSLFAFQNELNDEFIKYFDETVEFRQASDFLNDNMGGLYNIEYSVHAGVSGGISDPQYLRDIERFAQWLRLQPEVVHVNSISDVFKRLNKNMHDDDQAHYQIPEQRDLAAQYLLLFEMSLPYGLDLTDQINIDKSSSRLIATMKAMSSEDMLAVERRVNAWFVDNMPKYKIEGASPILMFAHIGKRNIKSMLTGTFLALVVISCLLMLAFGSIRLGLISMIPNLAPAGVAYGIWGLIDGQIGLSLSVVSGMTLGIVVDDTIHFISKFQRAVEEKGLTSEEAIRHAFSTVGVAMWITSLVLISGFMVLGLSHFVMNSEMGLVTAMTITIALFLDLLLLPPLLMRFPTAKQQKSNDRGENHA
jgi:predicted RND superfamily exporter protein